MLLHPMVCRGVIHLTAQALLTAVWLFPRSRPSPGHSGSLGIQKRGSVRGGPFAKAGKQRQECRGEF